MCFVWSLEPGLVARMHSHVRRVDISCENDSCQSSNGDLVCQIQTSLNLTSLSLVDLRQSNAPYRPQADRPPDLCIFYHRFWTM